MRGRRLTSSQRISLFSRPQSTAYNVQSSCSVRIEAVMALGSTAHLLEARPAMDKLIKFYTDRCFEVDTHRPKPHRFESMAEQLVNQVSCSWNRAGTDGLKIWLQPPLLICIMEIENGLNDARLSCLPWQQSRMILARLPLKYQTSCWSFWSMMTIASMPIATADFLLSSSKLAA